MKLFTIKLYVTTILGFLSVISFSQTTNIWEVESECITLKGSGDILDPSSTIPLIISDGYGDEYTHTLQNGIIRIDFTNTQSPNNWSSIDFKTVEWTGNTGNYFVFDGSGNPQTHNIATGYVNDFSDSADQYVSFDIQVDKSIEIWTNLSDIVGRYSNGDSPKVIIPATVGGLNFSDESKWQHVVLAWNGDATADASVSIIEDWWSQSWNGVNTLRSTPSIDTLDLHNISGVSFTIDPFDSGVYGDEKSMYIRNLTIGTGSPNFVTLKPIEPIGLSYENDSVAIDLLDYYTGSTAISFMAGISAGNNVLVSLDGSVVSIKAKNKCTPFNNTVQVQLTDADKVYTRTFPVIFNEESNELQEIGVVTVDSTGTKILLAWERPNTTTISSYSIYREGLTDQYTKIGEVPYDSISVFVDSTALINTRAYKYKISYENKCGIQSDYSTPHKSIHLQRTFTNNELHLNWTTYEGAPVLGYRLVAGDEPQSLLSVDEFAADQTSYTIINPTYGIYRIETIMANTINPSLLKIESGPFTLALSNIAESQTEITEVENGVKVYPTLVEGIINVELGTLEGAIVSLVTANGETVYTKQVSESTIQIPTINFAKGSYNVVIQSKNVNETVSVIIK